MGVPFPPPSPPALPLKERRDLLVLPTLIIHLSQWKGSRGGGKGGGSFLGHFSSSFDTAEPIRGHYLGCLTTWALAVCLDSECSGPLHPRGKRAELRSISQGDTRNSPFEIPGSVAPPSAAPAATA